MTVKVHVEAVKLLISLDYTSRGRLSADRGRTSANYQCPGAGQAPVEETRPSNYTASTNNLTDSIIFQTASIIILMASKRTLTASTVFLTASARPLNPLH
jgi:hypothetical protein